MYEDNTYCGKKMSNGHFVMPDDRYCRIAIEWLLFNHHYDQDP